MEAVAILGREIIAPRGPIGLGKDSLDHSIPELRSIFTVLADTNNYPVLIHCTQGKDRTGLVVTLLLLLLGVPVGAISPDYMASENELKSERQSRLEELRQHGMGEEFTTCPAGFVQEMADHLQHGYGGVNQYLTHIGVDEKTQNKIKENMLDK